MEPKAQREPEKPKTDELNEENLENVSGGLTTSRTAEPINDGRLPAQPAGAPSKVEPINS
jgi:hypothetical protein